MTRRTRGALAAATAAVVGISVAAAGGAGTALASGGAAAAPVVTRAALDPALVAGRGRSRRLPRAGGRERRHQRHGHRPRPDRVHAAGRGVRPEGGAADAGPVRRVHAAQRRPTRSPCGTASPTRPTAAASPRRSTSRVNGKASQDHDADLAVRLALQPVPVHQRPQRRPAAPGLVDHRVRVRAGSHDAARRRSPSRSGRCTSTTSSACCSAAPTRPATGSGSRCPPGATPPGRSSTCSTRELVGAAARARSSPRTCCCFGADPSGRRDSADAFDRAIAFAQRHGLKVYVPPGTYQVNRHIIVDDVTIEGAGSWYTIIKGKEVALETPAPGRLGAHRRRLLRQGRGGRRQQQRAPVRLRHRGRRPRAHRHRPGQRHRRRDERLDDRRPLHPPHQGRHVVRRADDEPAGHQQRHRRPDRRRAELPHRRHELASCSNNFVRNTGDDGLAMWSEETANAGNTFDHNTVQTPTLANGIAIYGGTDNTVSNNLVADPIREGSGMHVGSRFGAEAFTGHLWITDNTTVRAGTYELNWNIGLGRDLDLRARQEHRRRHPGGRRPLPRQHLQRDHAGQRLAGEGPVLDHERPLQGHPGRRHGHLGASAPGWPGRPRSRTSTRATSARSASTTAGRSTSRRPARSSR